MSIRQLPSHVIDKLKSSVIITSLNGVACGLLANALDAGASKVNISIDYARGNCTVEDNGSGIAAEEFQDDGGIGKLHHTSRFPARANIHGKNGDFLASLATLSLLCVSSRRRGHISHNSLTIHNSTVLSRNLPAPLDQRIINFDYGTRVVVRDLFGAMPVRVKQRATVHERPVSEKEWSNLVREVVALLLAWPSHVTVSLKNVMTQKELRFRPPEEHDVVLRTSRLLNQASLADWSDVDSWVPISASSGHITIKGCICETPAATRRSQFISLGVCPMMNEYGTDVIYEEINRVFHQSSFGVVEGDDAQHRDSTKLEDFTDKELRSRKGIEKWPMFYFKIVTTGDGDVAVDKIEGQSRTLAAILDLLKATCYGFLKKHHFRPRKVRMSSDESVFSTSRTVGRSKKQSKSTLDTGSRAGSVPRVTNESKTRADSPFDVWNRVKVGKATAPNVTKTETKGPAKEPAPLVGEGGRLLRKPFDEPLEPGKNARDSTRTLTSAEYGWPLGYPRGSATTGDDSVDGEPLPKRNPWLQEVMKSWANPVFETVERDIPSITANDDLLHQCGQKHGIGFDTASMTLSGRVSRLALASAAVISQVDRKFILVKLPLESAPYDPVAKSSSALIMLDQHAADERCRLEDLMAEYFAHDDATGETKAAVEVLERPLVFEVSSKEHQLLHQNRDHFAAWGIVYSVPPQSKRAPNGCKVVTMALPPSILERCRQEPRLLIELMRKEVWHLVDSDAPRPRASTFQADKPWVSRFHGCPQGIIEMLHSRACRSAIMFNDALTHDECAQLVSRLSRCAFPFQCAHGRPSMAPLVDVGVGGRFGWWEDNKRRQDKDKWRAWLKGTEKPKNLDEQLQS